MTQRNREPEEENDPENIRALARAELHKYAPPRCADIEERVEKAVEMAGFPHRFKDRRRYVQTVRWNARQQAVLAWRDFYRDPIRRKLGLEDLQQEHELHNTPAIHAALLKLEPEEQWVYLLRTRIRNFNGFNNKQTMKIIGMGEGKVDRVFCRAERRINP